MEGEDPFNWTYTRTNIFLDMIIDRLPRFRNPKVLKLSLWAEILEELSTHYPYNVLSVKKLKKKFDNMKKTFVKNKDQNDIEKALQWPYFRRMDEIVAYLNDKIDYVPSSTVSVYYEGNELLSSSALDEDKGFNWNITATNLLLDIVEDKLSNSSVKIKNFWQVVTDAFLIEYHCLDPFDLDVKKISKKFSNMKKTYLKNKKKLEEGTVSDWPFYKQVERIVENHGVNSVKDVNSSADDLVPTDDDSLDGLEDNDLVEESKPACFQFQGQDENDYDQSEEPENFVEFEMLDEEEESSSSLRPVVEFVSCERRCRVCYEAVTAFRTFADNIQTGSGQDVSIDSAFAFSTKYDLGESRSDNILCFSCTNSLKFVYEFLEKAEESKQKFDQMLLREEVSEAEELEEFPTKSYDLDDIIEEDDIASMFEEDYSEIEIRPKEEVFPIKASPQTKKTVATATKKKMGKFICGKCKKPFTSENLLRRHIKMAHRFSEYRCSLCDKTFANPNLLNRHTSQIHRPGRDFLCHICRKAFQYKERLTAHMKTHSTRNYGCHICPKAYVSEKELNVHIRTHTNEKPYKCDHCEAAFAQKDRLTHHVKKKHLHIVYRCKYCDSFSSANHNTTRRHEMEHFKFAYECDWCPKKYSKRDRLVFFVFLVF